jgi:hypothetical protein
VVVGGASSSKTTRAITSGVHPGYQITLTLSRNVFQRSAGWWRVTRQSQTLLADARHALTDVRGLVIRTRTYSRISMTLSHGRNN